MINYGDKYDLERNFKDVIYELRSIRDSACVGKYFPEALSKCRELELFLKGIMLEINEMEYNDDDL